MIMIVDFKYRVASHNYNQIFYVFVDFCSVFLVW